MANTGGPGAHRDRWREATDRVLSAVGRRVAVDSRALAAFRIALGTLLLLDLLLRARNLRVFYTDAGVLPRAVLARTHPLSARYSLHALSGGAAVEWLLFAVAALVAIALIIGHRSRLAALLSLLLLLSLHARNPFVLNGGDLVLRRLLFWAVLLPIGGRWSIDALRRVSPARDRNGRSASTASDTAFASVASAGLLLQVVLIYAVNAVFKARGEAWAAGDAVRMVFSLEQFLVLLGPSVRAVPVLLVAGNYAWLALVAASPLLVLLTGWRRGALALGLAAGHLGMLLTMRLGIFPLVSMASLVVFLPPGAWNRLERRVRGPGERAAAAVRERAGDPPWSLPAAGSLRPWLHQTARVVAALAIVAMLIWQAAALGYTGGAVDSADFAPGGHTWRMFAPEPLTADTDYVANGTVVGTGETVDVDVPVRETARWRKYLVANVGALDHLVPPLADHLCDRWVREHPGRELDSIAITEITTPTVLDGPEKSYRDVRYSGPCPG